MKRKRRPFSTIAGISLAIMLLVVSVPLPASTAFVSSVVYSHHADGNLLAQTGTTENNYLYTGADPVNNWDPSGMFEFTLAGMSVNIGIRSFLNMKGIMLFANVLGTALDVAEVINRPCRSNFFWLVLGILDPTDVARTAKLVGRGAKAIDAIRAMVHQLDSGKRVLAEEHIINTGITVLGHRFGPGENYIEYAKRIKASYFYVEEKIFNSWQTIDQYGANFHFLDKIAERGDTIKLAVSKNEMDVRKFLQQELDYLTKHKGYYWVDEYTLKRL